MTVCHSLPFLGCMFRTGNVDMVTSRCVCRPGNHPDKLGRLIAVCVKHLDCLLPLYVFSSKYNKHNMINCQMSFNILHRNERSAH